MAVSSIMAVTSRVARKKSAIFDLRNVIFNTIVCPCVAICKVGARA